MKLHSLVMIAAGTLIAATLVPQEAAAQQATAGIVSGKQKVVSSMELPDGRTIRRMMLSLEVTADDTSSIWHLGSQDCFATYMFAADGSLIGGRGLCDFVSPDGDLWWLTLEASGDDPIRWKGLGGTGKFAAVEHSGTTVTQAEWGDGKMVARWEGTMTEK
jgi:hypothetical protein